MLSAGVGDVSQGKIPRTSDREKWGGWRALGSGFPGEEQSDLWRQALSASVLSRARGLSSAVCAGVQEMEMSLSRLNCSRRTMLLYNPQREIIVTMISNTWYCHIYKLVIVIYITLSYEDSAHSFLWTYAIDRQAFAAQIAFHSSLTLIQFQQLAKRGQTIFEASPQPNTEKTRRPQNIFVPATFRCMLTGVYGNVSPKNLVQITQYLLKKLSLTTSRWRRSKVASLHMTAYLVRSVIWSIYQKRASG